MKVLVVSDLHVGSLVGLCPPEVEVAMDDDGERVISHTANRIQQAIWAKWEAMCDEVGRVDALVCNGDACEGSNRKGAGIETWTTDINAQVSVAAELLDMVRARKRYVTQGSAYHVGDNGSMDERVARNLKTNASFHNEFVLSHKGKRVHFRHKIGGSSVAAYRTTPIARELMSAMLNESEYGHFDAIVRSHVHYHIYAGSGSAFGLTTPCWKGRDRYGSQHLGWLPKLGYVLMDIGDDIDWEAHTFSLKGKQLMPEVVV